VPRERNARDVWVQRGEEQRLQQRRLARVRVQLWRCRGTLLLLLPDLDQSRGSERGEEVGAQDTDVADRRGGDVVLNSE
jgi:hypothetical protein